MLIRLTIWLVAAVVFWPIAAKAQNAPPSSLPAVVTTSSAQPSMPNAATAEPRPTAFSTSSSSGQAAAEIPTPPPNSPSSAQKGEADSDASSSKGLSQKFELLQVKFDSLTERLNTLYGIFNGAAVILGVFAVFLAFLAGIPVVFAIIEGSRTNRRAEQTHSLFIKGETTAQQRSEQVHHTFLEASKTTLDLVNSTLLLAKEANENAAKVVHQRATDLLRILDSKARILLTDDRNKDDRALVSDPELRSDLISLAQRISSFETNRFIFPIEIPLTPHCEFIRGMHFHLNQQFDDAFECWRSVALSDQTPDDLKSLAWYWIGYENNNLGHFGAAADSFSRAESLAHGPRKFELKRIRIESVFFDVAAGPAENSIAPLRGLLEDIGLDSVDRETADRRVKIITTLGNVLLQAGREAAELEDHTKAAQMFDEAGREFEKVAASEKWARFGLGEAYYHLGKKTQSEDLLKGEVRQDAQKEDMNRIEPRTKVLARTTELMCCLLVPELKNEAPGVHLSVINALGMVDSRLTVYSQMQNRNVQKAQFEEDLRKLLQAHQFDKIRI